MDCFRWWLLIISCEIFFKAIEQNPKTEITIDLQDQIISFNTEKENFEINAYKKICMTNGYDDIDYLLSLTEEIKEFDLVNS